MKEQRRRPGRGMPFRNSSPSGPGRAGAVKSTLRGLLVLTAILVSVGGLTAYSIVSRGLSAHDEPSRIEELMARVMRRWATPASVRSQVNPVQPNADVLAEASAHFADHCATCHSNDGSGDTAMGRGMYPKVPDMRTTPTQSLTDGELFSIIEHGIRLTGMPGWGNGTPEGERESWALVHFVRRLPKLTPDEIERMESLNPKTPAEWQAEEEARRFLQGSSQPEPPQKGHRD